MNTKLRSVGRLVGILGLGTACGMVPSLAAADVPCGGGELDECRALIEINATDGDLGFHALFDSEGWDVARILDPNWKRIFSARAKQSLRDQTLTEIFFESDEPPCWFEEGDEDVDWDEDEVVTIPEFLERFPAGAYKFRTALPDGGQLFGETHLSHALPAAPREIEFDGETISWEPGNDLGQCEPEEPSNAGNVPLAAYEVVMEPDLEAEDPADEAIAARIFRVLVPPEIREVRVPDAYLASFAEPTPAKIEVIAIELRDNGSFGNQTAAEEDGFSIGAGADAGDGTDEEDSAENEQD